MRPLTSLSCGLLSLSLLAGLVLAKAEQPPQSVTAPVPMSETADAAILKRLQQPVTVEFQETPLKEALADLAAKTSTNLVVNAPQLADEGISQEHPVSLQLKNVSGETALQLLLRPLGLDWIIEEEVIQITTGTDATEVERHGIVRVYDVSKLLKQARAATRPKVTPPTAAQLSLPPGIKEASQAVPGQFGGMGFYCPGPQGLANRPISPDAWLIDAVQTATASSQDLWMDVDGTGGSMSLVGQSLVVRHTFQVQRKIAALLQGLEAVYSQAPTPRLLPISSRGQLVHQAEAQLLTDLNKTADLKAVDMPLNEVLNVIASQLGHPVLLDQSSLNEEGIQADEPVSVELKGVSLRSALKIILSRLGLIYTVSEGVLHVTTESAEESLRYPCLAICHVGPQPQLILDQITAAIQANTGVSWLDMDGTGGTISECPGGVLVVKQSESGLRAVENLLEQLLPRLQQPRTPVEPEKPDANGMVIRYYRMPDANLCQQLQKALPELVSPDDWKLNTATIHSFDTTLIIRQTPAMQQRITDWLIELAGHLDLTQYPTTDEFRGLHFIPGPTRQTGGGFFSVE